MKLCDKNTPGITIAMRLTHYYTHLWARPSHSRRWTLKIQGALRLLPIYLKIIIKYLKSYQKINNDFNSFIRVTNVNSATHQLQRERLTGRRKHECSHVDQVQGTWQVRGWTAWLLFDGQRGSSSHVSTTHKTCIKYLQTHYFLRRNIMLQRQSAVNIQEATTTSGYAVL